MRALSWQSILAMPALAAGLYLAPLVGNAHVAAAEQSKKTSHRSLRQGMFALSQIDFSSVVMLGDSLTEGAQWSEITGCPFVANRGIGSDDSAGVLRRLDEVTKLKPSAVFLMIGVNDVASGVSTDDIVDNVRQTIDRLTKARAQVYLTLVLPVAQSFKRKINPKIDELNAAYTKLAERGKVTLVDFRSGMKDDDGYLRDEFTIDGIHLIPDGYRVWRDAVLPLVQKHCPASPVPSVQARPLSATPSAADIAEPVPSPSPNPSRSPNPSPTPSAAVVNDAQATAPGEFNARFGPWR